MITTTDLDERLAAHLTRVARVDQEAWMWEASVPAARTRPRRVPTVVASIRRQAGVAVVRVGTRLQGTPTGPAVDRAAV